MNGIFFVVGPTAVGKTSFAVDLARDFGAEIVSADAFQIYRGLDILTAKPSEDAQHCVRHHLISQVSLGESMSAVKFGELATAALTDIRLRKKRAIVVGGSGLYLKGITHGFDEVPAADHKLREQLNAFSVEELARRLTDLSPQLAARTDLKNPRRIIRAIEIASAVAVNPGRAEPSKSSRERFRETPGSSTGVRNNNFAGVLLLRDRYDLYQRINERVKGMFRDGVEQEVSALQDIGATAGNVIGLKEIRALMLGRISRQDCIAKIQQATRRYAKRQLTWFRHQTNFPALNLTQFSHREAVRAITRVFCRAEE